MCLAIMCHFAKDKLHICSSKSFLTVAERRSVSIGASVTRAKWKMQQDVAFTVPRLATLLSWQFV